MLFYLQYINLLKLYLIYKLNYNLISRSLLLSVSLLAVLMGSTLCCCTQAFYRPGGLLDAEHGLCTQGSVVVVH